MNYNYEQHTWGGDSISKTMDYPRLKYDILKSVIEESRPKKLLDIGCGAGKFLATLQKEFPEIEFTGIDASKKAIAEGKKAHPKMHFFNRNAEDTKFNDEEFDIIIMLDVLEHVRDPEKALSEVTRILRKNGLFHTFIPCESHSIYWLSEKILGFHTKEQTAGHIQRFSRKTICMKISKTMEIKQKRYSFHLMGSIMDYGLFTALLNKRLADKFWNENKFYTKQNKYAKFSTKFMNKLLETASAVAYMESKILIRVPYLATGIHITAKRIV